ncbi:hypothetical protein BUALT_Bualt10G0059900 [Buddleja alternifolia]|uniref:Glutathione peroxidase n=1 Tax=Buddleja alternifolia TaxID=168488 RepID=A0AAV6X7C2_9LAMI|nr:hypothetical protein BUALT_Bualt10G0059900 [Buddleja alternifolia]
MSFLTFNNWASLLFLGFAFWLYYKYPVAKDRAAEPPNSIYEFTVKDIRGNDVPLSNYLGKVLLIVNVASKWYMATFAALRFASSSVHFDIFFFAKNVHFDIITIAICGLTHSNYKELNILYGKYKYQDLEILAFPCNQFASQEPGNSEEIEEAVCTRFKAEFPIFEKIDVNGKNTAPLYKFLKSEKGGLFIDAIKWNFTKFLVNKQGKVVERYAPTTSPLQIEEALIVAM